MKDLIEFAVTILLIMAAVSFIGVFMTVVFIILTSH